MLSLSRQRIILPLNELESADAICRGRGASEVVDLMEFR
jgi:hypothetical protein